MKRPSFASWIAISLLMAFGASHLVDHYGSDNFLHWLMVPFVPLLCPEAFLSSGIRTPDGGIRYVGGIVLNSYFVASLVVAVRWGWRQIFRRSAIALTYACPA